MTGLKSAGIWYQQQFKDTAYSVQKVLSGKGYATEISSVKEGTLFSDLPKYKYQQDILAWFSHGGWDGPTLFPFRNDSFHSKTDMPNQIGTSETEQWNQLRTYLTKNLRTGGVLIAHSCHSGGSDSRELSKKNHEERNGKIWIKSVATDMRIFTFGQAGPAAASNPGTARLLLRYVFDKKRGGMPFKGFAPGGSELSKPGDWPKL